MAFRLDRTFVFERPRDHVWALVSRPEEFPRWWTWLRRIESDGLVEGTTARCLIRAPVPFPLRLGVRIDRIVPEERIEVTVTGDLDGAAALELAEHDGGTAARLVWELEAHQRLLRAAGLLTRPALQWGQDWVVATGVRQFRQRALGT
jgi:uncharacterized protein YndB with AHSA1/START domain